ncbi:RagB/SusD family nutrient uptake outer membrane protein [Flavobacteriaceae bacterium F08102]|nr:RagB/SusD family nutrient uptake outer membrane protein [Flavobacteriaceae bacterium F08102]
MKNLYKIRITLVAIVLSLTSCEIAQSLDDVENNGVIPIDEVYQSEALINLAVTGTYATLRTMLPLPAAVSAQGISARTPLINWNGFGVQALNNDISPETSTLRKIYAGGYNVLVNTNELINNIPNSVLSEIDKKLVIGEAKFLRAVSRFYLLRSFGQFYNLSSAYGITLDPLDSDGLKRNTVQESYDAIIEDLDAALDSGIPQAGDVSRATLEGVKAFKAKVLFFMGKYVEAAALANDFISLTLNETYTEVFENSYESSDVLFATATDFSVAYNLGGDYNPGVGIGSPLLDDLFALEGDEVRKSPLNSWNALAGFKYTYRNENAPAWMHLRIPEIWLIYAEARTRIVKANGGNIGDLTVAIELVNKIRSRVDLPAKNPANLDDFLEMIRLEKWMELHFENGEDWFDLIRYHLAGDLDIKEIKPTVTSEDQFIMPIPSLEVLSSNKKIQQNPGYDQ